MSPIESGSDGVKQGSIGHAISNLVAAISIGALQIGVAVSLAVLVFGGELSAGVPRAAIAYIVGTGLVVVIVGGLTKMRISIAGAQDTAAIVAAALGAGIASQTTGEQAVTTTVVAIALAGLVSGILFVLIGRARLGEAARSIPFTVISGFMAGTGWLLLRGGIEVMAGRSLELGALGEFASWELARLWLPGLFLAIVIAIGLLRGLPSIVFGLSMLVTAITIHVVGRVGWSAEALELNGWLIGPFPDAQGWIPIRPSDLADADWRVISNQVLPLAGLATVSLIGVVLNLTGLEVALEDEVDIDHELQIAGAASVVSAAAGGMIGYHLLGDTVIADRLEARGRAVPVMIAAMCAAAAFVGTSAVALMPRAVAGGVLAAAGINLLISWARQLSRDFGRLDAILSALVLLAIIAFGVLTGIAAGILAAVVVFVFSYGRVSPIRRSHRMDSIESNIDRPAAQRAALLAQNDSVVVLELDGYLFFGSLRAIADVIKPLLGEELRYLILDFRGVRGVDASVVSGLLSIERKATAAGVTLVWSHLRPEIARRLAAESTHDRKKAPDIDHALEWVEEVILETAQIVEEPPIDVAWLAAIEQFGQRLEVREGETLIDANDDTRRMFAVVSGTLTAWGQSAADEWIRYRKVGPGSFLGEVAFISGAPRSASVVADCDAVVIALAPSAIGEMEKTNPSLAIQTNALVASRLAERLASTTRSVRNLSS